MDLSGTIVYERDDAIPHGFKCDDDKALRSTYTTYSYSTLIMSHLVKNEDLQDYIQSLAVKRGCPVDNIDKNKAHWDLIMTRKAFMEAIRVYKGEKLFSCSLCSIRFTDQCNRNSHRRKVKCTERVVKLSVDDVSKIKWDCNICGKSMSSRSSRDRRQRIIHKPK